MIKTIEEELRSWLRPMSPLTAFAKSLKGEGETAKDPNAPIPFDIDLDELPTDLKEKLTGLKKSYEDGFKKLNETEERRKAAEDFARKQQSEAGKAKAVLQRHNLSLDGDATKLPPSADADFDAQVAKFLKDGLPEPQAKAYAKMFVDHGKTVEASVFGKLAPLAQQVGGLQANMALANARAIHPDVFKIPELNKEITEATGYMLQQGNVPTEAALQNLVEMAWGKHMLANPTANVNKENQEMNLPKFGQTMSNGHHSPPPPDKDGKPQAPRATQPETMAIMAQVTAELNRGIPTKKGGK